MLRMKSRRHESSAPFLRSLYALLPTSQSWPLTSGDIKHSFIQNNMLDNALCTVSGEAEAVGEDREDSEILWSNWQWAWRAVGGGEMFGGYNYPFLVVDGGITVARFDGWIDLILKLVSQTGFVLNWRLKMHSISLMFVFASWWDLYKWVPYKPWKYTYKKAKQTCWKRNRLSK